NRPVSEPLRSSISGPWRRYRALGRGFSEARRNRGGVLPHEPHLGDRRGKSTSRGRTWSRESGPLTCGGEVRLVLRARSFEPKILHDWRERRRKLRRSAHARLWCHF